MWPCRPACSCPEGWESALLKPTLVSGPKGISIPDLTAQIVIPQNDTTSLLAWEPPASVVAGPATVLLAESDIADWVGEGQQRTWTNADAVVTAADNGTRNTGMSGDADDDIQAALPYLTAPGSFRDLDRFAASVTENSGGCNASRTNLVVDRLVRDAPGRPHRADRSTGAVV